MLPSQPELLAHDFRELAEQEQRRPSVSPGIPELWVSESIYT